MLAPALAGTELPLYTTRYVLSDAARAVATASAAAMLATASAARTATRASRFIVSLRLVAASAGVCQVSGGRSARCPGARAGPEVSVAALPASRAELPPEWDR